MPITFTIPNTLANLPAGNQPASTIDTNFQAIVLALSGVALQASDLVGMPSQSNLAGDAGIASSTKARFTADFVSVINLTTFSRTIIKANGTTFTNDINVVGAGGRDTVATIGASNWVHYYWIYNGVALSTIASLTAPITGPLMPAGYTQLSYIGSFYYNASPLLVESILRCSRVYYAGDIAALSGGTSTTQAAVSLATLVPPNACEAFMNLILQNTSGGAAFALIGHVTGLAYHQIGPTSINTVQPSGQIVVPMSTPQNVFYTVSGASMNLTINLQGYTIPNGAN